jgi:hypothetical protein
MPGIKYAAYGVLLSAFFCVSARAQAPDGPSPSASPQALAPPVATPGPTVSGADVDSEPIQDFQVAVRSLYNQENFQQLDDIADAARSQKSRFLGGGWKLGYFYEALRDPGSVTATDAAWKAHFERLQRWAALSPQSITPRVALAGSYLQFAWKARGNGYAKGVTDEAWKLFHARVRQAEDSLEDAASLSTQDPQWYVYMQSVAMVEQWSRESSNAVLARGSGVEPGYFYLYNLHATSLLPKWGGKVGEAEAFAQSISDSIGGAEGDYIYFVIALDVDCCRADPDMPGVSWDRVKQGFAALERLYGSTNRELNALAFMAVRQGDSEFAQQLFARIGDDWDQNVWRGKERFESSKSSLSLSAEH